MKYSIALAGVSETASVGGIQIGGSHVFFRKVFQSPYVYILHSPLLGQCVIRQAGINITINEVVRMSKYIIPGMGEVTVIHTMADGTVRDSVEGYEFDITKLEPAALRILQKWLTSAPNQTAD